MAACPELRPWTSRVGIGPCSFCHLAAAWQLRTPVTYTRFLNDEAGHFRHKAIVNLLKSHPATSMPAADPAGAWLRGRHLEGSRRALIPGQFTWFALGVSLYGARDSFPVTVAYRGPS